MLDDIDDEAASDQRENKPGSEVYAIISVLNSSPPKQTDNFSEDTLINWETALVESSSTMPDQTPIPRGGIGGGFDMRFLDRMYEEGAAAIYGGSYESSVNVSHGVPVGYDGHTALLSLPAPPAECLDAATVVSEDPFAVVPASVYNLPMGEMEKQQVLMTEQLMWPQTYSAGDAMQGQAVMAAHPYQMGVYTRN